MIMILKQKKIKFKPRIKLNHNINIKIQAAISNSYCYWYTTLWDTSDSLRKIFLPEYDFMVDNIYTNIMGYSNLLNEI